MSVSYLSHSLPRRGPAEEVAPEDWDLLFAAVLQRLRDSVQHAGTAEPLGSYVLECIQELEHLRRIAPQTF